MPKASAPVVMRSASMTMAAATSSAIVRQGARS